MLRLGGLLLRLMLTRRRVLAAWAVYAALLAVLYAGPAGPVQGAYAVTGAALLAVTTWLVLTCMVLDRPTTSMLAAAAGGPGRLHLVQTAAGLAAALPLVLLGAAWGAAATAESTTPATDLARHLALGVLAHLAAALVGTALGTLASRPVTRDDALSLPLAVTGCVLAVGRPESTPFGAVLTALAGNRADLPGVAAGCLLSASAAVAASLLAAFVVTRWRSYGTAAQP